MKIGIYTIHACNNFGALLQAYATAMFLKNNGYDAELVNVMSNDDERKCHYIRSWKSIKGIITNIFSIFNPKIQKKIRNFEDFRKHLPLSKRYYSKEEYISAPICYDIHLVGSDQVWNVERGLGDKFYFLPFLNKEEKKVSFASSFGNVKAALEYKNEITNLLNSFSSVSVREDDACQFLNDSCGIHANSVLDPTFLLSNKEWDAISGSEPLIKGKYILYYGFDSNKECGEILKQAHNLTHLPIVGVSVGIHSPYKFNTFFQKAGPIEFLNLIKNAELVITSSFHGMALSLNFRKQFFVIKHGTRMSRMENILSQFDLRNRIVMNVSDVQNIILKSIDYDQFDDYFDQKIENSRSVLINFVK